MKSLAASSIVVSFWLLAGCGGSPTSPSPGAGPVTIGFDGFRLDAPLTTLTEAGFTVTATRGSWAVRTSYGNPAPFIEFLAPPGDTVTGEIVIMARRRPFRFEAADLYSSTTRIPYTITGLRNASTAFTFTDTLPITFGRFRTVVNPHTPETIDVLIITLSNAAFPCCDNPMGVDTIRLQ